MIFPVLAAILGVVVVAGLTFIGLRLRARRLSSKQCMDRWKALQKHCATRKTWPQAIIDADKLLEDALRSGRYKGKTTGERLVAAQHKLTNNESVWFGHKLRARIAEEDVRKLRKQDILESLNGFRQALRDLGALRVDEPTGGSDD